MQVLKSIVTNDPIASNVTLINPVTRYDTFGNFSTSNASYPADFPASIDSVLQTDFGLPPDCGSRESAADYGKRLKRSRQSEPFVWSGPRLSFFRVDVFK